MQPITAVGQRIFVERNGQPYYLDGIALEELGREKKFTLTGYPPENLDLISPQILWLVFQKVADPWTFFDAQQPGMIVVLEGFCAVKDAPVMPPMLVKSLTTGEVTISMPEVEYTCEVVRQRIVGDDN